MYTDIRHLSKQAFFNKQYQQELNDHPELVELDERAAGSTKEASAVPSTSTGTPQPASNGPTRIKLVNNSNGTNQVNGGASAAQSDED